MSVTIYPNAKSWIMSRNGTSNRLTSENCEILLNSPIEQLNKIIVDARSVYVIVDIPQTQNDYENKTGRSTEVRLSDLKNLPGPEGKYIEEWDITKYVVEAAKYNTLPIGYSQKGEPSGLLKNNTVYYEHNSKKITLANQKYRTSGNISYYSFASMIQASFADGPRLWFSTQSNANWNHSVFVNTRFANTDTDPRTTKFRIYYTPLGESVKLEIPKTNPPDAAHPFHIPYSQQQPIVDNISHGREMQSIANRTGCEMKEIVRTFKSIRNYRSPHDGWYYREKDAKGNLTGNIWRLTGAKLQIFSDHLFRSIETWSKNWMYRSENVPINREFRSWNIPADIVQRNLHWNDYCLITRNNVTLPDDTLLSNWAKKKILSLWNFQGDSLIAECSNMWFYNTNKKAEKFGTVLSCSAFGFGNSLVFSGKTKDNLSVGVQRDGDDFCKDVYYSNADGTLGGVKIQLGPELDVAPLTDVERDSLLMYPEFKSTVNDRGGTAQFIPYNAPKTGGNLLFKEGMYFDVDKDPAEQLNFTYQLHLLTDDGRLVIGASWAANCPLVKQRSGTEKVKVWRLKHFLPQGAQVMTKEYGTMVSASVTDSGLGYIELDKVNNTITFEPITKEGYVGWCLTDEDDNVLLAYNGIDGAVFSLKYTHFYKSITDALSKL